MSKLACLVGNGLSIAYNSSLSVDALTQQLLEAFSRLGGSQASAALAGFAQQLSAANDPSFEQLLGPLEAVARALPDLPGLSSLAAISGGDVEACATTLAQFAAEIHRVGIGTSLDLIASHGQGAGNDTFETVVVEFGRKVAESGFESPRTIATLNYDGLLTAAFLRITDEGPHGLSDLGHGADDAIVSCVSGNAGLRVHPIRTVDDLIRDMHLLHLHGSLGWLADPASDEVWKFELADLRDERSVDPTTYWQHLAEGSATLIPRVVLTDRKQSVVTEWPFSLAYSIFEQRLRAADHWLIAGYGFGDEPVNAAMRRAIGAKSAAENRALSVFVIDKGDENETRGRAERAMGRPPDFADCTGFPAATHGSELASWLSLSE